MLNTAWDSFLRVARARPDHLPVCSYGRFNSYLAPPSRVWRQRNPLNACDQDHERRLHRMQYRDHSGLARASGQTSEKSDILSFEIRSSESSRFYVEVRPTPKANRAKLANALSSLLENPNEGPKPTFGSSRWILDEAGDAIHRHLALASDQEASEIESRIMSKADEMNHHPHVIKEALINATCFGLNHMTITCTTHSPKGLSMRDVRLATAVDEIVAEYDYLVRFLVDDQANCVETLTAQKRSHLSKIRDQIQCSTCG